MKYQGKALGNQRVLFMSARLMHSGMKIVFRINHWLCQRQWLVDILSNN